MPLLVKSAETLSAPDVAHEHSHNDGFDIVLPDLKALKGDLLLWCLVGVAAGYLGYLVWSEVQRKKRFKTLDKPSDESKGL